MMHGQKNIKLCNMCSLKPSPFLGLNARVNGLDLSNLHFLCDIRKTYRHTD